MPTYRNDGAVSYKVYDKDDNVVVVPPGASVETLEDPGITDFTETVSTPTNKITVSSAPGASGTFTDKIKPDVNGNLNISISGSSWEATVWLRRSPDNGVSWFDVASFSDNVETSVNEIKKSVYYDLGVKNGEWATGSINLRLYK